MYFGLPFYVYALNYNFDNLLIPGTCPFLLESIFFYLIAIAKIEIHISSNKHETGLARTA